MGVPQLRPSGHREEGSGGLSRVRPSSELFRGAERELLIRQDRCGCGGQEDDPLPACGYREERCVCIVRQRWHGAMWRREEQGGAAGGKDAAAGDVGRGLHRSGRGSATFAVSYGGGLAGAAVFPAGLAMVLLAGSEAVYRQLPAGDPAAGAAADVGTDAPQLGRRVSGQRAGGRVSGSSHRGGRHLRRGYTSPWWPRRRPRRPAVPDGAAAGVLCNFLVCIAVWMSLAPSRCRGSWRLCICPSSPLCCADLSTAWPICSICRQGILAAGRYGVAAED